MTCLPDTNRLDAQSILTQVSSLSPVITGRWFNVQNTIDSGYKWSEVRHGSYVKNAPILSLADWKHVDRYSRCGVPNADGYRNCCNQPRFCCYCSWKKGSKLSDRLASLHSKSPCWTHLTISYKSNLPVDSDSATYRSRYIQGFALIQKLLSANLISGAVAVGDLSIPSLAGRMVFPHLHTVLSSTEPLCTVDESGLKTVNPEVQTLLDEAGADFSFNLTPIQDKGQLISVSKYLVKAIDLKRVYEEDLKGYSVNEINTGLDAFLQSLTDWEYKFIKIKYFGVLKPGTKHYLGR